MQICTTSAVNKVHVHTPYIHMVMTVAELGVVVRGSWGKPENHNPPSFHTTTVIFTKTIINGK